MRRVATHYTPVPNANATSILIITVCRVWDLEAGECTKVLDTRSRVACIALSPDGKTVVSGAVSGGAVRCAAVLRVDKAMRCPLA
jgi:WD40 repeat protein